MGASKVSEMLGGEASRSVPETCDRRLEATLLTASLSSAIRRACSRTSEPASVSRKGAVDSYLGICSFSAKTPVKILRDVGRAGHRVRLAQPRTAFSYFLSRYKHVLTQGDDRMDTMTVKTARLACFQCVTALCLLRTAPSGQRCFPLCEHWLEVAENSIVHRLLQARTGARRGDG